MSAVEKKGADKSDLETTKLVKNIEKTRANMAGTLAALETKLSPAELRGKMDEELTHVEEKVRDVIHEQIVDAKALVKEEIEHAKILLRDEMNDAGAKIKQGLVDARETVKKDIAEEVEVAEKKIRQGLVDAKDVVKQEVREAVTGAGRAVRAATLGRVEDLATDIGDTMNKSRDTFVDTIRQNPIPAALVGVGIAWLFMNRSSSAKRSRSGGSTNGGNNFRDFGDEEGTLASAQHAAGHVIDKVGTAVHQATDAAGNVVHRASDAAKNAAHQATDGVSSIAHQAADGASSLAHQATDAASHAMHDARDAAGRVAGTVATQASGAATTLAHGAGNAASYVGDNARSGARRVEKGFQSTLQDNPLALGAAALAVGAVIGYALPSTSVEDKFMGAARDKVMHRVEDATHDAAGKVGQFADKTAETAKGLLGDGAKNEASAAR